MQDSESRAFVSDGKVKRDVISLRGRSSGGSRARGGSSSRSKDNEGGEFFAGVILIVFALPMVWMNERKDVKYYEVIMAGKKAVK